jgi:hypothetical protein
MIAEVEFTDYAILYILTDSFKIAVEFTDEAVLYILTHSFMIAEVGFTDDAILYNTDGQFHDCRGGIHR